MLEKLKRGSLSGLMIAVGLLLIIQPTRGADFPKKPVKIVIPSGVGGGEDSDGRALAPFLQKYFGVNVLIETQPGAGGKIAFERFQKTEPDGYSIVLNNFPKSIIIEYMGKVNFKTRDFIPISSWNRSHQLLSSCRRSEVRAVRLRDRHQALIEVIAVVFGADHFVPPFFEIE